MHGVPMGRPCGQRERWLPELCSMERLARYCLTEASCGSDAAALKTRALIEDCRRTHGSTAPSQS